MSLHSLISMFWITTFCLTIITNRILTSLIYKRLYWTQPILCPRRKRRLSHMRKLSLFMEQLYLPSSNPSPGPLFLSLDHNELAEWLYVMQVCFINKRHITWIFTFQIIFQLEHISSVGSQPLAQAIFLLHVLIVTIKFYGKQSKVVSRVKSPCVGIIMQFEQPYPFFITSSIFLEATLLVLPRYKNRQN